MPGADQLRGSRERDKLTIAEACADLGISCRTFYEWRAKGRAPRCITPPTGAALAASSISGGSPPVRKPPDD